MVLLKLDRLGTKKLTYEIKSITPDEVYNDISKLIDKGYKHFIIAFTGYNDITLDPRKMNPKHILNVYFYILRWNSQGTITIINLEILNKVNTQSHLVGYGTSIEIVSVNNNTYYISGGYGFS